MSRAIGVFPILNDQHHHIGTLLAGPDLAHIFWPESLQKLLFTSPATKLAFIHLFLITVGILCAVYTHADSIKDLHFTCFTDSPLLLRIMHKRQDKACCKTSALIEAISVALIHLDVLPSFELSRMPSGQDA